MNIIVIDSQKPLTYEQWLFVKELIEMDDEGKEVEASA